MTETSDPLAFIQTRRHLEEVNLHILHGDGEILEVPGKLSLVWTDPVTDARRFLSIKAAGAEQIIINGRRYPATESGLRQGLRACLAEIRYP
jgi:hypothetical protein